MTKPKANPYQPLPVKVLEFLRLNPEEELSAVDIAAKFDVTYKNVHSLLAKVLEAKQVVRTRNDDGEYIYRGGPCLHMQVEIPAAALHTQRQAAFKGVDIDAVHDNRVQVDWQTLAIDTQTPPPIRRRGTAEATYVALLDRLTKPGHSFAVPSNAYGIYGLKKVITSRHKTTRLRYQYVEQGGQTRFWRVA